MAHGLVHYRRPDAPRTGRARQRFGLAPQAEPLCLTRLLVVDEVGYLSYSNRHADLLFELVSRRYGVASTVVTTNRPFGEWHEVFPNAACVVSLVDRLVHRAEVVAIEGESYRVKERVNTLSNARRNVAQLKPKRGRHDAQSPTSGTSHGLDFLISDNWSAGQALAVVELLDDLRERIARTTKFRSMNCCTNSARLPTILTPATSRIHSDDHRPTTAGHNRPLLLTLLLNLAPPFSAEFARR